jgi:aminoglycoside 6'-N-acetyltransferase I
MSQALFEHHSAEELAAGMREWRSRADAEVFIAERAGGSAAGFVEVGTRPYADGCETSPVGYVEAWYVDPDVRRTGVGRALLAAAEAWARDRGYREMASDAQLDNAVSHAAHRRAGYEEVDRVVQFRKDLHADAERRDDTAVGRIPRGPMKAEILEESATFGEESLILAVFSVDGATAACTTHGDRPTVAVLSDYYARVAAALAPATGQVIKVMGDGMLVVFPPANARAAEATCRQAQAASTRVWQAFDPRCRVRVKLGAGTLVRGRIGPPGEERVDVYGDVLNQLYKASGEEFLILPALAALLA